MELSGPKSAAAVVLAYMLLLCAGLLLSRAIEPVRVSGGSMYPTLVSGDVVLVRKTRHVGLGDVVLMRIPGQSAVLHRAVDFSDDGGLVTRGDANDVADRLPIASVHVRGRVVAVIPVGKMMERWRAR